MCDKLKIRGSGRERMGGIGDGIVDGNGRLWTGLWGDGEMRGMGGMEGMRMMMDNARLRPAGSGAMPWRFLSTKIGGRKCQ